MPQVKSFSNEIPLVVFSGDAFNPSIMSTITMGKQMVPVLNSIGVHIAAVGNHDLDYGVENMSKLCGECNFPWLMANVLDKETGEGRASRAAAGHTPAVPDPADHIVCHTECP